MREDVALNPDDEGTTHVNVYSQSRTELGNMLSNFYRQRFTCEDGEFESIEAYWYWLGCKDDRLRDTWGFNAKKLGRELGAKDWLDVDEFKNKIKAALRIKINDNKQLREALQSCNLPLTHYYNFSGKIVPVPEASWIIDELELIREELKNEHA